MSAKKTRLDVAILAIPEATASVLFSIHDMFTSVGRDWNLMVEGAPGEQRVAARIVSLRPGRLKVANDVTIQTEYRLDDCPRPDIICIPELFVAPDESLASRHGEEIEWLKDSYNNGATLAAACSGALMLAESGLLDGQDATTHWGYCRALSERYPEIRVHPNRSLVVSGVDQRIIMAGGGTSWTDLVLYLVARFVGVQEAVQLAKVYLIDWHEIGQQPYASLVCTSRVDDPLIQKCQTWLAGNYEQKHPVAAMAGMTGLPDRSFKRRFAKATGMSPIEYIHTLRVEEAKQILETTGLPVESVANDVGYEDGSFFRRLFRRKVGITPQQYRKRFRGLREVLSGKTG